MKFIGRKNKERMADVLLDEKWYPSLPRFQIFVWTVTIVFSFLWVTSYKLNSLDIGYGNIPYNLLLLMGISAATYTLSKKASDLKYTDYPSQATEEAFPRPVKPTPFSGILYDGDKKSLSRVQYFVWTIISIKTYLIILIFNMTFANGMLKGLPDLPLALTILMGIGQGIFVGGKYMSIKNLFTEKADPALTPATNTNVTTYTPTVKINNKVVGEPGTKAFEKDAFFDLSVEIKDNSGKPKKDIEVKFIGDPINILDIVPLSSKTEVNGIATAKVKVISKTKVLLKYSYTIDGKEKNAALL